MIDPQSSPLVPGNGSTFTKFTILSSAHPFNQAHGPNLHLFSLEEQAHVDLYQVGIIKSTWTYPKRPLLKSSLKWLSKPFTD